jgi:hypothetical protein
MPDRASSPAYRMLPRSAQPATEPSLPTMPWQDDRR